jgi:hypothetical protein
VGGRSARRGQRRRLRQPRPNPANAGSGRARAQRPADARSDRGRCPLSSAVVGTTVEAAQPRHCDDAGLSRQRRRGGSIYNFCEVLVSEEKRTRAGVPNRPSRRCPPRPCLCWRAGLPGSAVRAPVPVPAVPVLVCRAACVGGPRSGRARARGARVGGVSLAMRRGAARAGSGQAYLGRVRVTWLVGAGSFAGMSVLTSCRKGRRPQGRGGPVETSP